MSNNTDKAIEMPSGGGSYIRKKNGELEKTAVPAPSSKPDEKDTDNAA